jgi:hypothetical protein
MCLAAKQLAEGLQPDDNGLVRIPPIWQATALHQGAEDMRSFGHWTPRYVKDRLTLLAYEQFNPEHPWLTRNMIEILRDWLKPTDVGLEFGSGRSTTWFARRVRHLTSVEHDRKWYSLVGNKLAETNLEVDYLLHEDGASHSGESGYVGVAKHMDLGSLDFCLIDGAARDHCALACLDKLKQGGILVVDNINWYVPRELPSFAPNSRTTRDGYASDVWMKTAEILRNWRCVWTSDGVTDTALWVHP